jgi:hypothetical protein
MSKAGIISVNMTYKLKYKDNHHHTETISCPRIDAGKQDDSWVIVLFFKLFFHMENH